MHWSDEGYLLSKNNFNENSIIIEVFTLNHGKHRGIEAHKRNINQATDGALWTVLKVVFYF